MPVWKEITRRSLRADVVGVQLDAGSASEYHAANGLTYPVVAVDTALGRKLVDWYRIRTVPLTLVIREDGRVAYSRFGRIEDPLVVDSVMAVVQATIATTQGSVP